MNLSSHWKKLHTFTKLGIPAFFILSLAACIGQPEDEKSTEIHPTIAPSPTSTTQSTIETSTALDLREANVLAVTFEPLEANNFRFHVTLQHDDEGEAPNFADYWQVEDPEGNILGKRILAHSHSNEPFTRSETIFIPNGITMVIVRGHDMIHGFGGQAVRVDLMTGITEVFDSSL